MKSRGVIMNRSGDDRSALYAFVGVSALCGQKRTDPGCADDVCQKGAGLYPVKLFIPDHDRRCGFVCRDQQKLSVPVISSMPEAVAERISDRFPDSKGPSPLRETSLSIAAIAYSVGFENNLYFSKAFKSRTHMSPSAYREVSVGESSKGFNLSR